ncbi:MAG: type II toxin-antitoxin system PrlF family antitoxin [Phormidesmis sp.]
MSETLSLNPKTTPPEGALDSPVVIQSVLTDQYQTTVPDPIRLALGLEKQDKIAFHLYSDGTVRLLRVDDEYDPIEEKFLELLAKDIEENPQRLKPITAKWVNELKSLVAGVDIGDIDQPLSGDDD